MHSIILDTNTQCTQKCDSLGKINISDSIPMRPMLPAYFVMILLYPHPPLGISDDLVILVD